MKISWSWERALGLCMQADFSYTCAVPGPLTVQNVCSEKGLLQKRKHGKLQWRCYWGKDNRTPDHIYLTTPGYKHQNFCLCRSQYYAQGLIFFRWCCGCAVLYHRLHIMFPSCLRHGVCGKEWTLSHLLTRSCVLVVIAIDAVCLFDLIKFILYLFRLSVCLLAGKVSRKYSCY